MNYIFGKMLRNIARTKKKRRGIHFSFIIIPQSRAAYPLFHCVRVPTLETTFVRIYATSSHKSRADPSIAFPFLYTKISPTFPINVHEVFSKKFRPLCCCSRKEGEEKKKRRQSCAFICIGITNFLRGHV